MSPDIAPPDQNLPLLDAVAFLVAIVVLFFMAKSLISGR